MIENLLLQVSSLYDRFFPPFPTKVPDQEADRPEQPVDNHCNPDSEYAHTSIFSQDIAESDTEDPHGENGNIHACFCISACPEGAR